MSLYSWHIVSLVCIYCILRCCGIARACETDPNPVVRTNHGPIRGKCLTVTSKNVTMFLGLPYAKAPIGNMRFKPTERGGNWVDVMDTVEYAPSCLRFESDLFEPKKSSMNHMGDMHHMDMEGMDGMDSMGAMSMNTSENCLYMNIFVPGVPDNNRTSPLPVLIWFPGHDRKYDGSVLAGRQDIIVVTVSYRTGLLGFLSLNDPELAGNFGLYDQRLSMMWISHNIGYFGGDPSRVTIAGQGIAGAMVGLHLFNNQSQKFFKRAISQSGSTVDPFFVRDIAHMHDYVKNHLSCKDSSVAKILQCLQDKPLAQLTMHLGMIRRANPYSVLFAPTVDGAFIAMDPKHLLEMGMFAKVDYLLGGNEDDGSVLFNLLPSSDVEGLNQTMFTKYIADIVKPVVSKPMETSGAVLGMYFPRDNSNYGSSMLRAFSDHIASNAIIAANYHAGAGAKTYLFRFSHRPSTSMDPPMVHAGYGSHIPFALGILLKSMKMESGMGVGMNMEMDMNMTHPTNEEILLSENMMSAWATFVKTGTPMFADNIATWDQFNSSHPMYMELTVNMTKEAMKEPDASIVTFWTEVIPTLNPTMGNDDHHFTTADPGHDHGGHTSHGPDHGGHTTIGHDGHSDPIFGFDQKTAEEAILALTIVVCFLFVVAVALIVINFKYGPKDVRRLIQDAKYHEESRNQRNNGYDKSNSQENNDYAHPELATKL